MHRCSLMNLFAPPVLFAGIFVSVSVRSGGNESYDYKESVASTAQSPRGRNAPYVLSRIRRSWVVSGLSGDVGVKESSSDVDIGFDGVSDILTDVHRRRLMFGYQPVGIL